MDPEARQRSAKARAEVRAEQAEIDRLTSELAALAAGHVLEFERGVFAADDLIRACGRRRPPTLAEQALWFLLEQARLRKRLAQRRA